jgi:hypothetical protein|eukprot:4782381-Prymnesium_polylepis.2
MLKATVCSTPKAQPRSRPLPTREEAIARAVEYRSRLTVLEGTVTRQREELVALRKRVRELGDVEKQLEGEKSKRKELEKLLFCERRRKRPKVGDGHDQEAQNDNGLRNRLLKVLRTVHPDRADPGLKLGPHEISAVINDLIAGGTGDAVFGCRAP